jgi:uncharacterized membrane protein
MSPAIALHLAAAVPALGLGGVLLLRAKGNLVHRILGRTYVVLMLVAALTSFWIKTWGHFSWIHLLSVWTLFSLCLGIWQIRRGNVRGHRGAMTGMYVGLVIAAVLALAPGRFLGTLAFGT